MANPDILWALDQFSGARMQRYALYNAYYLGDQNMMFATDKFRSVFGRMLQTVSDNMCASVVDIPAERLEITGFTSSEAEVIQEELKIPGFELDTGKGIGSLAEGELAGEETDNEPAGAPEVGRFVTRTKDPLAEKAWDLWEDNALDLVADEIHREMFKTGDGFAIVWPDEDGDPCVYPQLSHEMAVRYSSDNPKKMEVAAKLWFELGDHKGKWYVRLNLYYDDHIEKYRTTRQVTTTTLSTVKPESFTGYASPDDPEGDQTQVDNPHGRIPVFHFPNRTVYRYGYSDLMNVVPLQDALNKEICDMLVAGEFAAFRQRWVTGIEVEVDPTTGQPGAAPFEHGADRIFAVGDPDAKFGEFGEVDLTKFADVQDRFRAQIARVAAIPVHYFYMSSSVTPTGEALKIGEQRFEKRMKKAQSRCGKTWEDILQFALVISGDIDSIDADVDLNAVWTEPSPRSDSERADVLLKKKEIGVSMTQLLKEAGYDDDQIVEMLIENAAAQRDQVLWYSKTQAGLVAQQPGAPAGPPAPAGDGSVTATPANGNTAAAAAARKTADTVVPPQQQG
jgi:hypothetical protein